MKAEPLYFYEPDKLELIADSYVGRQYQNKQREDIARWKNERQILRQWTKVTAVIQEYGTENQYATFGGLANGLTGVEIGEIFKTSARNISYHKEYMIKKIRKHINTGIDKTPI